LEVNLILEVILLIGISKKIGRYGVKQVLENMIGIKEKKVNG
jgi:hypothetical protein